MKNPYDLVEKLKKAIDSGDAYHVYTGYSKFGALFMKENSTGERILVKPWSQSSLIGEQKLLETVLRYKTFKGYNVDRYIFVGPEFRPNGRRFARRLTNVGLLEFNSKERQLTIFGSVNIPGGLFRALEVLAGQNRFSMSYDFDGLVETTKGSRVNPIARAQRNPTAFCSYSWDNEAHRRWVLKLVSDLIKNGVETLIDEWDLDKYSGDINQFIESGIRDADHIILVCTPLYAKKANTRSGGVGIESTIITGEFFSKANTGNYIPVIRKGSAILEDCLPSYLKTRYAIDFSNDTEYSRRLEDLLRHIYKRPRFQRPNLGAMPNLPSADI